MVADNRRQILIFKKEALHNNGPPPGCTIDILIRRATADRVKPYCRFRNQ